MNSSDVKAQAMHDEGRTAQVGLVDPTDVEKINQEELQGKENPNLRLDKRGLPLVPQPTIHKDDPLVSPVRVLDCQSDVSKKDLRIGLLL